MARVSVYRSEDSWECGGSVLADFMIDEGQGEIEDIVPMLAVIFRVKKGTLRTKELIRDMTVKTTAILGVPNMFVIVEEFYEIY